MATGVGLTQIYLTQLNRQTQINPMFGARILMIPHTPAQL